MKIYVITDPCYLVDNSEKESKIWSKFVDLELKGGTFTEENRINATKFFKEELGLNYFEFDRTGYGDWTNLIRVKSGEASNVHLISQDFCADTGLVCVAEVDVKMLEKLFNNVGSWCFAAFEAEEVVSTVFDKEKNKGNWTVVTITTKEGAVITTNEDEDNGEDDYLSDDEPF